MTAASARTRRADGSQPRNRVRAKSHAAGGDWERSWYNRLSRSELGRHTYLMRIHRNRLYRARRAPGAPPPPDDDVGVPTLLGIDVLDVLVRMAAGGVRVLAISYRELATRTGCSISAVHEQLCRLKAAGMLNWARRCRPTEGAREFGTPQWEQAENLYRLDVPPGIRKAHARTAAAAAERRQADIQERARRLQAADAQANPEARQRLAAALARADAVFSRESRLGEASGPPSMIQREGAALPRRK